VKPTPAPVKPTPAPVKPTPAPHPQCQPDVTDDPGLGFTTGETTATILGANPGVTMNGFSVAILPGPAAGRTFAAVAYPTKDDGGVKVCDFDTVLGKSFGAKISGSPVVKTYWDDITVEQTPDYAVFIPTPPTTFSEPEVTYTQVGGVGTLEFCLEWQLVVCDMKLSFLDVLVTVTYDLTDDCEECAIVTLERPDPEGDTADAEVPITCALCPETPGYPDGVFNPGNPICFCIEYEEVVAPGVCFFDVTNMKLFIREPGPCGNDCTDARNAIEIIDLLDLEEDGFLIATEDLESTCDDGSPLGVIKCQICVIPNGEIYQRLESGGTYTGTLSATVISTIDNAVCQSPTRSLGERFLEEYKVQTATATFPLKVEEQAPCGFFCRILRFFTQFFASLFG